MSAVFHDIASKLKEYLMWMLEKNTKIEGGGESAQANSTLYVILHIYTLFICIGLLQCCHYFVFLYFRLFMCSSDPSLSTQRVCDTWYVHYMENIWDIGMWCISRVRQNGFSHPDASWCCIAEGIQKSHVLFKRVCVCERVYTLLPEDLIQKAQCECATLWRPSRTA